MDVKEQFGNRAKYYGISEVHARGPSLQRAVELAAPQASDRVLDVATGAGHMAFAVAPFVSEVVCLDLTPAMLKEAALGAESRGFRHLRFIEGDAEEIPFPEEAFDIVFCRVAAHHFRDLQRALAEMVRVTKQGGRIVIVDTTVPEDDKLARKINHMEVLRDPTHVKNYRLSEWMSFFDQAGLTLLARETDLSDGEMSFAEWVERSGTVPQAVVSLWQEFTCAEPSLAAALQVRRAGDDLWFQLPRVILAGRKN